MNDSLKNIKIVVVGLGYVGLPLAVEFSKLFKVIGFDTNKNRINELKSGFDKTNEINKKQLNNLKNLKFTYSKGDTKNANIYIITVPTPVDKNNHPDLAPLKMATEIVANNLKKGDIIIYESTVFPGATEDICVPILESFSKLKYNKEFFCGYSPERINPGDKEHTLTKIKKITSGSNKKTAEFVDLLYNQIIKAGTFKASSIPVAEAAKVIENTQRDVNIALSNELALIFNKLNLDTGEILEAAGTKWNFLPFRPGLVGGHCIGVDPYYLTYKAAEVGYHPEMILAGRRINDNMGQFIAENTIAELTKQGVNSINSKIAVLGFTFKENCPDLRNTKVISIVDYLNNYGCKTIVTDDCANRKEAKEIYDVGLVKIESIKNYDAIILAVQHENYTKINLRTWEKMLSKKGVLIDVKSTFNKDMFLGTEIRHWRL